MTAEPGNPPARPVRWRIFPAVAIIAIGLLFLLQLDWGTWWPLFVILGGLFTLIPQRRRNCHGSDAENDAVVRR